MNGMIEITRQPLNPEAVTARVRQDSNGAVVTFLGTTRDFAEGRPVAHLEYEAYEPMALKKLEEIRRELRAEFGVADAAIAHRIGPVAIGQISLVVAIAAPHRKEAFLACHAAVDRLKEIVPIWKKETFADGGQHWVACESHALPPEPPAALTGSATPPELAAIPPAYPDAAILSAHPEAVTPSAHPELVEGWIAGAATETHLVEGRIAGAATETRLAEKLARRQAEWEHGIILPGTTIGGDVGTFSADFVLWNADQTAARSLNGLVDTGASYTMIPASILEELGIAREDTETFNLADGSRRAYDLGIARLELAGKRRPVAVIFGPENAGILLGALTLEVFALAADAKYRRLIPAVLTL